MVPLNPSIRLDVDLRERLTRYMDATGLTFSQAVRLIFTIALRNESEAYLDAARRGGYREGIFLATRRLGEVSAQVFKDIEEGKV